MHKESFIITRNTLLHVSTLLGHLQGEHFFIFTLRLHSLQCSAVQAGIAESSRLQYTVKSTFSLNYKVQP
jgi:hypothetical protein